MELLTNSIVSLFDTNKKERQSFVTDFLSRIENGSVNPLQAHYNLKCMNEIIKGITENDSYNKLLLSEAEKYGGKSFDFKNSLMQVKELGTKWHYDKCNDDEIKGLLELKKEIETKIKERENFLKSLSPAGIIITDKETGETREVFPPYKTSTTGITINLK